MMADQGVEGLETAARLPGHKKGARAWPPRLGPEKPGDANTPTRQPTPEPSRLPLWSRKRPLRRLIVARKTALSGPRPQKPVAQSGVGLRLEPVGRPRK